MRIDKQDTIIVSSVLDSMRKIEQKRGKEERTCACVLYVCV